MPNPLWHTFHNCSQYLAVLVTSRIYFGAMTNRMPGAARLCLLLSLLAIPAKLVSADRWVEVRSPHFTVSSNAGEADARRIANQIEEIRAAFLQTFPALRLDPGKPTSVIAVKNEDSMKVLLPDYWLAKDRMHPASVFMPGLDRNFAVLRTDVGGSRENPYHELYYAYTASIHQPPCTSR
jgi:hypothetical protein